MYTRFGCSLVTRFDCSLEYTRFKCSLEYTRLECSFFQVDNSIVFDFDIEVQPILDVLVHKTIEQSIIEVKIRL